MRLNTLVMLLVALVFGALAVFLAQGYLVTGQRVVVQQGETVVVQAPALDVATIVVAAREFRFGETLSAETLREIPWPRVSLPEGSFARIEDVIKDDRRVALNAISLNEPILAWKISGPGARASLSATVTPGMRAVAVRMNDVVGVGGFILPGDRVDVLFTATGSNEEFSSTDTIIQNARVLGVDQLADEKAEKPVVAKVVTLEVTTTDAQKLTLAQSVGSVSLSLRAAGSTDRAVAQRVVDAELVSSPSVYLDVFNKTNAQQAELEKRLKSFEGALAMTDAELKSRLVSLQKTVDEVSKKTGEGEEAARKRIAEIEKAIIEAQKLGGSELRNKVAALEAELAELRGQPVLVVSEAEPEENPEPPPDLRRIISIKKGTMAPFELKVPPDAGL